MSEKHQIFKNQAIQARIKRMAFEIYERNYSESKLFLVGIDVRGTYIATQLKQHLEVISPLQIEQATARPDRRPQPELMQVDLSIPAEHFSNQVVVVIDDVLYTGRTMLHVVNAVLQAAPRKIQTLSLIDRGHRSMPIRPDFVGTKLATTIQQHVSVEVKGNQAEAFLS